MRFPRLSIHFIAILVAGLILVGLVLVSGPLGFSTRPDRVDVTREIFSDFPFLKPGLRFWDQPEQPSVPFIRSLHVRVPGNGSQKIENSRDLLNLVSSIRTERQALQYVRFLTNDGEGEYDRLNTFGYFPQIPFTELRSDTFVYVRNDSGVTTGLVVIEREDLARYHVESPSVAVDWSKDGLRVFHIRRHVFLMNQLRYLSWVQPSRGVREIGFVTEMVTSDGRYEYRLEQIPVEDFQATFQPLPVS